MLLRIKISLAQVEGHKFRVLLSILPNWEVADIGRNLKHLFMSNFPALFSVWHCYLYLKMQGRESCYEIQSERGWLLHKFNLSQIFT